MSFPPRPPMPMGGMPPMMQSGYGMMPNRMGMMGMPPQPMGMMGGPPGMMGMPPHGMHHRPMRFPPGPPTNTPPPPEAKRPASGQDRPPATTVFVGNIVDKAPDHMIRQMLQRCGNVLSWKRVQGASGKLQAFGFCEFEDPEATLRCMRLLNDWPLVPGKHLVVKVDAKTKDVLDEYRKTKSKAAEAEKSKAKEKEKEEAKEKAEKEEGEEEDDDEEETKQEPETAAESELDEMTQREDRVAQAGIDAVMKEYARDLEKLSSQQTSPQPQDKKKRDDKTFYKDQGLEGMELEPEQVKSISAEIESFRSRHKPEENEKSESERERERERIARRKRELEEQERERERRQRERERDERREREEKRERDERREKERSAKAEEEKRRRRHRSVSSSPDRSNSDDEEDEVERKILERRLRDKEAQYQERLRAWEARERKKSREYEKEAQKETERRKEERREAKRLREFLEDYDDEKHDPKYYRGSALTRRQKEREKEMEADARDRAREREEVEELKRQLLAKGGQDVDDHIAKLESEKDAHLLPRMRLEEEEPEVAEPVVAEGAEPYSPGSASACSPSPSPTAPTTPQTSVVSQPAAEVSETSPISQQPEAVEAPEQSEAPRSPVQLTPQPSGKRRKLTAAEAFAEDEQAEQEQRRKRKLVPLDYGDTAPVSANGGAKALTAEEKRLAIKKLIEDIPTVKEDLFKYPVDWTIVDNSLMEKRIKPWITKKIIEYIGEEEPTLTDFICQKVMSRSSPGTIIKDISMILDEEAELFIVKMWRLLIYETEAKKAGLVK